MTKITLPDITSGYNLSAINSNFQKIEDELNNKVLYRQTQDGEPNAMSENLDMNSNRIINLPDAISESEPITLRQLIGLDSGDSTQLRADLASPSGASLVGAGTYAQIRASSGAETRIRCLGRTNVFDGAFGYFSLDLSDTTTADNDGTVLVDALARRWKREYSGSILGDWWTKGDGIADDTLAIIASIRELEKRGGVLVLNRKYKYSTVTAGGMVTFQFGSSGRGAVVSGGGTGVINTEGAGVAWAINTGSNVNSIEFSNISFINVGTTDVMCVFNVQYGKNIWGASARFDKVNIKYFKDTQMVFTQAFNCTFNRCEFIGADGQTYGKGIRLPAVAGATSSCLRISGGNPSWSGGVSISNLFRFEQCVFQGAKYGIDGYYLDQSVFDGCTWQYLWIGVKLAIDGVHGNYGSSKVVLQGFNYAEWISNRLIADVPILDDGTTEGAFLARGSFSSATRTYVDTGSYQGANFQAYCDAITLPRFVRASTPESTAPFVSATTYDPDTQIQKEKFVVLYDGTVRTAIGYSFDNNFNAAQDVTEISRILRRYMYRYHTDSNPDAKLANLAGTTTETSTQLIGHLMTCLIKASGTITGTGGITISTGKYVSGIANVSLVSCGNSALQNIYARTQSATSNTTIHLYKDSNYATPLQASDLTAGGSVLVQIGLSWFQ